MDKITPPPQESIVILSMTLSKKKNYEKNRRKFSLIML